MAKATGKEKPGYEKYKAEQSARMRASSAKGREIGGVPDIANVKRRAKCRGNLKLFCETYNPNDFRMKWSPDHLRVISRIEEAATLGALFAFAMPRGSGKTTICRMAALWALSYGHCRYAFIIGATAGKAEDSLSAIKSHCRFLPAFTADFPEISWPAISLGGIANRANGQTCGGESTLIEWAKDQIIFPTVPPPANWPKAWPLRGDGQVPTSGAALSVSGLTGDGIRGSLLTLSTGESIRPDFVLIDDPQTPESSRSPSQNATREQLISADVLGMAGPGKTIGGVMPCTVISKNDMVDRVLDRVKHPMWRGERTKMLRSMPSDMAAWDRYFEVYHRCAQSEPPSFQDAHSHYRGDRANLDLGAEASWPQRKLRGEVSAIQHAMNLYVRDRSAFMSEYQNDPEDKSANASLLDLQADVIVGESRLSHLPRFAVPRGGTRLTAFVDVHKELLYYGVAAWDEKFNGSMIDYGTWPPQNRSHFSLGGADPKLSDLYPNMPDDAVIFAGLRDLFGKVMGREYPRDGDAGEPLRVERCLVDSGWKPDVVYGAARQTAHATNILPSKGYAVSAKGRPMAQWALKPGERAGWNWRIGAGTGGGRGRGVLFDPNQWKTFTAERLLTPPGSLGCLQIYGDKPYAHQLLAEHLTAEYPTQTTGHGRTINEWQMRPDRVDNHWFDVVVGCCVGASVCGLHWSPGAAAGLSEPAKVVVPRKKMSDMQRDKMAGRMG